MFARSFGPVNLIGVSGDDMGTIAWICLIESFQMSTIMRGLLCEGVMIWVPLDLSH